jgi:hypothetical protein
MKKIIFAGLLFAPTLVFANVRINEIAWMGNNISTSHEWIELYNDADASQDLSGWKLVATETDNDDKEKFSITLSGVISEKGYFLIESKRSESDKAPYLASDFTQVSFSLLNGGETLRLKNVDNLKMNEVKSPFKTKWEKGDNATKETMQWNGTAWITAPATPRVANQTVDTAETTSDIPTNDPDASLSSDLDTSAHISPLPLSDFSQKQELYISAGRNRIVSVGNSVVFEAYAIDAKGAKSQNISAAWSFGDGAQARGAKVSHTYKYPGDYVVVLNANAGGNEAVSRASVRVFAPKIILFLEEDGAVSLENDFAYEINIGEWKIRGANGSFVVSSDTIILPGKKLIFSKANTAIDFSKSASIELLFPDGVIGASFAKIPTPIMAIASSTFPVVPMAGKIIEPPVVAKIVQPVISPKPKTQLATAALATPEPETTATTAPAQKIILKKPEGFFAKIWHFFFR